jgi:pimeloyl-ACP methyl ester carboxylesterase
VILLALLLGLLAAGIAYQAIGSYYDTRRFPAPGRFINVGRCSLHIHQQGTGQPAVVLEAGIAGSSLGWALVQPKLAAFTTVCSYDRAGLGWSGGCSLPRTVQQMASELKTLLSRADLPGPYILVGHSFGGLLIRAYANLMPDDVAGLVFVDPVSLDHWVNCEPGEKRRLRLGARLSRRGAILARAGIVRAALTALASGGKHFPKLVARTTAGKATGFMERLIGEVRKLPPEVLPIVRAHWSRPKGFHAMAAYLESLPDCARIAAQMPIPPRIPSIILSASTATEHELNERDSWIRGLAFGRHARMEEGGHWLQLDQPDNVVAAVVEVMEAAKVRSTTAF